MGTCTKRTGSTRHDLGRAADVEIWRNGKALDFTRSKDLPFFSSFVRACAALGATGIGAGTDYMGSKRVHVGYGKRAIWGAAGKGANAPTWLREAASSGWSGPLLLASDTHRVTARDGLILRAGPGTEFMRIANLDVGTLIHRVALDGSNREWARVDLRGDGLIDGHAHSAFLEPSEAFITDDDDEDCDDCGVDV